MKRLGGVWDQIISFSNLQRAYRVARRGKGDRASVGQFSLNLEEELITLQRELKIGSWHPGDYRLFTIYERKPRLISAAPFRDRVVHHAVMDIIGPALDRTFICDSYACRVGKGVHAAVNRYQIWANRYHYALKMDVRRYFPSVDHYLLKGMLTARIKDRQVLALLEKIIDTSPPAPAVEFEYFSGDDLFTPLTRPRGIPIGNLTSQFFANLYLDNLDHWLKETLKLPAYLRYVDDLIVLGDDKKQLVKIREAIEERLGKLRLHLHPNKGHIVPTAVGLDVFGYFVRRISRRLRPDNGHRFARRLREFSRANHEGRLAFKDFNSSIQAWIGHAQHADTEGLRRVLFDSVVFKK